MASYVAFERFGSPDREREEFVYLDHLGLGSIQLCWREETLQASPSPQYPHFSQYEPQIGSCKVLQTLSKPLEQHLKTLNPCGVDLENV